MKTDLEMDVEHACRSAWLTARDLEGYRWHPGARDTIAQPMCMDDLERARDYLSRLLDNMRGVR